MAAETVFNTSDMEHVLLLFGPVDRLACYMMAYVDTVVVVLASSPVVSNHT